MLEYVNVVQCKNTIVAYFIMFLAKGKHNIPIDKENNQCYHEHMNNCSYEKTT